MKTFSAKPSDIRQDWFVVDATADRTSTAVVRVAFSALAGALILWQPSGLYLWIKALHIIAVIAWMAGMLFLGNAQAQAARQVTPLAAGLSIDQLRFRYDITGDKPAWRPLRAFDDGEKVYIQFPHGIAQGELPPLFVIGPQGDGQLVNYRFRPPYYIVDRLFGAAELRLGGDKGAVVRIERTDGVARRN